MIGGIMAHCSKGFWDIIDVAKERGCRIERKGFPVTIYAPNKEQGFYIAHPSEKGLHPARRFIQKVTGKPI